MKEDLILNLLKFLNIATYASAEECLNLNNASKDVTTDDRIHKNIISTEYFYQNQANQDNEKKIQYFQRTPVLQIPKTNNSFIENINYLKFLMFNSIFLKYQFIFLYLADITENLDNKIQNKNSKIYKKEKKRIDLSPKIKFDDSCCFGKKISKITTTNNKYVKSNFLEKKLKIKIGDHLEKKKILQSLNFINLNPFRKVEMIFENLDNKNCNIEIKCQDRHCLRPYIGCDNTGLKVLERNRFYAGLDWNYPFCLDSILSYQFLSSFDFKKFQGHTGRWIFFLPWQDYLTFYGTYNTYDVDQFPDIEKNVRIDLQASFRYNICLPILNLLSQNLILGFDFKSTNSNLLFPIFMLSNSEFVNLTQFLVSYGLNWNNNFLKTNLLFEIYFSLGPIIRDEENYRYNDLRSFAENKYIYAKGYIFNLIKMPKNFLVALMLTGQIANKNLLPSETFSLGGYNTVRGYYEREINTDSGIILNFELRSPAISLLSKKANDSLSIIAFFDYGFGTIHQTLPFEEKNYHLLGFGPGLRYVLKTYLTTRLDLGIKGKNYNQLEEAKCVLHFSFNIDY